MKAIFLILISAWFLISDKSETHKFVIKYSPLKGRIVEEHKVDFSSIDVDFYIENFYRELRAINYRPTSIFENQIFSDTTVYSIEDDYSFTFDDKSRLVKTVYFSCDGCNRRAYLYNLNYNSKGQLFYIDGLTSNYIIRYKNGIVIEFIEYYSYENNDEIKRSVRLKSAPHYKKRKSFEKTLFDRDNY